MKWYWPEYNKIKNLDSDLWNSSKNQNRFYCFPIKSCWFVQYFLDSHFMSTHVSLDLPLGAFFYHRPSFECDTILWVLNLLFSTLIFFLFPMESHFICTNWMPCRIPLNRYTIITACACNIFSFSVSRNGAKNNVNAVLCSSGLKWIDLNLVKLMLER